MNKKKLRVCYLATTPIPSRAAYSVHVMKMCQSFTKADCVVCLISPEMSDKEEGVLNNYKYYGVSAKFEHLFVPWPQIKGIAYIYGLRSYRLIRAFKPDIVYGRFLFGVFVSALFGIPSIFESHAPIADAGKISENIFRLLIKLQTFKQLIVISGALKQWYISQYPELIGKIVVAPDGADELSDICKISFVDDTRIQVGYIGQLYEGKGLEVIEQIAPKCPWANFHIIGGTEKDISRWTPRFDSANVMMYGYLPHSEVGIYQASFDVLLAPYQEHVNAYGGKGDIGKWMSPLKIFEYMAAGKAMLVSDLPVLREVLEHEKTAILCPSIDYEAWKSQLWRLSQSKVIRERLGNNARDRFKELYTWDMRAAGLKEKIESLIQY